MKTAIYIEDGVTQLVITPETEFEKKAISVFNDKPMEAQLFSGSFYNCAGGWVRQTAYQERYSSISTRGDESLIIKTKEG